MVTQLEETIQDSLDKKGETRHEAVSWHGYVDAQHAASAAAAGVAVQNLRPILQKVRDVAAAARRGETIGQSANMGLVGSGLGGGCSLYVSELAEALGQMPSIEEALAPEVRSVVLSMFAEATIQLYLEMILGCRKLIPPTVELLLNDAATVQVMLMEMMDEASGAMMMNAMRKLMGVLEVMRQPREAMARAYLDCVGGRVDEFGLLLDTLDGMDKNEKRALLGQLVAIEGHGGGAGGGSMLGVSGLGSGLGELGGAAMAHLDPMSVYKSMTGLNLRAKLSASMAGAGKAVFKQGQP